MQKKWFVLGLCVLALLSLVLVQSQPVLGAGGGPNAQTVVLGGGSAAQYMTGAGDNPGVVNPTSAEHQMGAGSWQAVIPAPAGPNTNFEFYIDPTVAPFNNFGAFKVKDIASISYYTKKGTPASAADLSLYLYTAPCTGGDASWYCHRLTAEPAGANNLAAPANTWNKWITETGTNQLRWYDSNRTAMNPGPTLADLQAGSLNWGNYPSLNSSAVVDYSNETVKFVKIHGSTSWVTLSSYLDSINITLKNGKTLTIDLEASAMTFQPAAASLAIGSDLVVNVNIDGVTDMYGYQFQVNYDSSKVNATGAFVNTWFDTTGGSGSAVPPGWNAACVAGVCKFAATRVAAVAGVSGVGTVAQITFHAVGAGTVPLTFSSDILSDKNATQLAHNASAGSIEVYGTATVSGVINMQGRTHPGDTTGTVVLTDLSGFFSPTTVNFDTNGNYTANVPVQAGGTTYRLLAGHSLYLSNQTVTATDVPLSPDGTATKSTTLLGGDANNSGKVEVNDLSCIGGAFGLAPAVCGTSGSTDINADNTTNILDLVLAGGNYDLSTPQPW